ncbi:hypothetical protein Taro_050738 [Colocasia esculenta]|uniref:Protein kinase domain-containing protein n=1 Tax=Colocasia esculenta TaxID=4460 RepID=A0A843XEW0_COLES|nr:hypothetical protein [Colocasia esculenta]
MNSLQGGQERNQGTPSTLLYSPIRRPPGMADDTTRQQHVCLKVLSRVCPVFTSQNHQGRKQRSHDHQLAELEQAVEQERNQNAVYKARLERTRDYLRYCLDKANEHGFLEFILENQQTSPPMDDEPEARPWQHSMAVRITTLQSALSHAKLSGWCIEPHEIELHEKIGQGTTADIYRGSWRGLDVAVKWIHSTYFCSNPCAKTWFVQELQTLSRQRHPFVLRLMGACLLPPERGWIVTELLSGKTLAEWLHGHKKRKKERSSLLPTLQERIEKGLEIAQAMQYLHEQKPKVIHRDLKPSNIFLDDALHVRVADFGHARFLLDGEQALTGELGMKYYSSPVNIYEIYIHHTQNLNPEALKYLIFHLFIGTYVYMAPEVIRCEPYDEKCDVYSFGIILNELITGQHPYIETDYGPSQVALEVTEGRLRPLLPRCHDKNKELIDLICWSWDGDASNRPSFTSVTSSLKKIREGYRQPQDG